MSNFFYLIFQILNRGLHPFSGRTVAKGNNINTNDEKAAAGLFAYGKELSNRIKPHKSSLHEFWPDNLRYSFDKTFIDGKRLTALAWGKVFSDIENIRENFISTRNISNERVKVKNQSGEIFEINRFCPHNGSDLCNAEINSDNHLVCPGHGWKFDLNNNGIIGFGLPDQWDAFNDNSIN